MPLCMPDVYCYRHSISWIFDVRLRIKQRRVLSHASLPSPGLSHFKAFRPLILQQRRTMSGSAFAQSWSVRFYHELLSFSPTPHKWPQYTREVSLLLAWILVPFGNFIISWIMVPSTILHRPWLSERSLETVPTGVWRFQETQKSGSALGCSPVHKIPRLGALVLDARPDPCFPVQLIRRLHSWSYDSSRLSKGAGWESWISAGGAMQVTPALVLTFSAPKAPAFCKSEGPDRGKTRSEAHGILSTLCFHKREMLSLCS